MSQTRRALFATTLVLAVLTAACGGGRESADDADTTLASSSPVVSAISLGSTQPEVERESAVNAWSELTAGLTEGSFVAPFESDGSLYGIIESSVLAPPPFDERFAVMKWDGENWVAVSGTHGPSCFPGSECYLDVVGDGEVTFPIVTITWCCPMDLGAYRRDQMASVFVIRDDSLVDLLPVDNQFWPLDITPTYFESDECVSGTVAYIDSYGYEDFYCYLSKTTRYKVTNGQVTDSEEIFIEIPDNPLQKCLAYTGETCTRTLFVDGTGNCTLDQITPVNKFPIRQCQYGYWVLEFEFAFSEYGYGVVIDGFLSEEEGLAVSRAQRDFGLDADGLIGPSTWSQFVENTGCSQVLLNDFGICFGDINGDGTIGPGDIAADG